MSKSDYQRFMAEDNNACCEAEDRRYHSGGGRSCGGGKGADVDRFFRDMSIECMLREVSKLPPPERKAALRELKRKAKEVLHGRAV